MGVSWVTKKDKVRCITKKVGTGENRRTVCYLYGDAVKDVDIDTVLNSDFVKYVIGTDMYTVTESYEELVDNDNFFNRSFDAFYEVNGVYIGATAFRRKEDYL